MHEDAYDGEQKREELSIWGGDSVDKGLAAQVWGAGFESPAST